MPSLFFYSKKKNPLLLHVSLIGHNRIFLIKIQSTEKTYLLIFGGF